MAKSDGLKGLLKQVIGGTLAIVNQYCVKRIDGYPSPFLVLWEDFRIIA